VPEQRGKAVAEIKAQWENIQKHIEAGGNKKHPALSKKAV